MCSHDGDIKKIAIWIVDECDSPVDEIEWLLEKMPKNEFELNYFDVLRHLHENDIYHEQRLDKTTEGK